MIKSWEQGLAVYLVVVALTFVAITAGVNKYIAVGGIFLAGVVFLLAFERLMEEWFNPYRRCD